MSLAELLVRKAPAELIVAQACAHPSGNPDEEKKVVGWPAPQPLSPELILWSMDFWTKPVGPASAHRQEGFLCHLGDDFVLSVPAVKWTLPVMKEIAQKDYKAGAADCEGKPFNSLRNVGIPGERHARSQYAHKGATASELILSVVRA